MHNCKFEVRDHILRNCLGEIPAHEVEKELNGYAKTQLTTDPHISYLVQNGKVVKTIVLNVPTPTEAILAIKDWLADKIIL
jgi:hypothetical protein